MTNSQVMHTANASQLTSQAVSASPKKLVYWKWVFISCGCILILLVLCLAVLFLNFTYSFQSSKKEQFYKSTQEDIIPYEIEWYSGSLKELNDKLDRAKKESSDKELIVDITEKEILGIIGDGLPESKRGFLNDLFIDIEPGAMTIKVDISKAFMIIPQDKRPTNIDTRQFEEVYLNIELVTSADGSKVTIRKIYTGDVFIDSFITADLIKKFQTQLDDFLEKVILFGDYKITKVTFHDEYVKINLQPQSL